MTPTDYINLAIRPAMMLLPQRMDSPQAHAMLVAIALQESRIMHRRQIRGPARGFLQFELIAVQEVATHRATKAHYAHAISRLEYASPEAVHGAIEHNDTLAAVCGRLLLWRLPKALPERPDVADSWEQYLEAWKPGKPYSETWPAFWRQAWDAVNGT